MLISSSQKNGFTLIEVMVAMLIFAVAILGTYKLQLQSTTSNALSDRVSTSTSWADYTLEELATRVYNDASWESDHAGGLDDTGGDADGAMYIRPDGSTSASAGGAIYSVFWNVNDDTPLINTKQIRVLVYRNGGIGSGLLYTHDFYKTKEDL